MRILSVNDNKPVWSVAGDIAEYPSGNMHSVILEKEPDYFYTFSCYRSQYFSLIFTPIPQLILEEATKEKFTCPP